MRKKTIVTLGLITGLFALSAGNAFAVVGAEPPPEGMMGITAVTEPVADEKPKLIDPNEEVSIDIEKEDELEVIKDAADDDLIFHTLVSDSQPEVGVTSTTSVSEDKESPNYIRYGIFGFLGVGALGVFLRKKLK